MTREQGWRFLDLGRRIERSLMVIRTIRTLTVPVGSPLVENTMLEAVLVSNESLITYRRRYRSYLQITTILELILFDETNPRSLIFQLTRIQEQIRNLPQQESSNHKTELEKMVLEVNTDLRLSDTTALARVEKGFATRQMLDQLLDRMSQKIIQMSQLLTSTYFTAPKPQHQLVDTYSESEE